MTERKMTVAVTDLPQWVPSEACMYLEHTEQGLPIRALARDAGCHASTIMRQIRRCETRRDDPLVDAGFGHLSAWMRRNKTDDQKDNETMLISTVDHEDQGTLVSDDMLQREAGRILRRLCENSAVLAVARDMEKGVVVREGVDGVPQRMAVIDRDMAEAFALKGWIATDDPQARVARYRITSSGRAAAKELMAAQENTAFGFADAQSGFDTSEAIRTKPPSWDSPLQGLARRRDRDGRPFLSRDLVATGERLREDFELCQSGVQQLDVWQQYLNGSISELPKAGNGRGAVDARDRIRLAVSELGPGLSDVVLRACCLLEGMETLEQRLGWSARSGKIVLRIALQRLQRHYRETHGNLAPKIG